MILREEDDGGRVMVMMNECDQEREQRSGYGDMQVERWRKFSLYAAMKCPQREVNAAQINSSASTSTITCTSFTSGMFTSPDDNDTSVCLECMSEQV